MLKSLASWILKKWGWEFIVNTPQVPKCVFCVAPHTSNWDFIMGELAIRSVGMKSGFLMKDTWFFFPLKYFLRAIGGVPVAQHRNTNVTSEVVASFNRRKSMAVAVTPEGTRSLNPHWHRGFIYIAQEAGVPIILAYIDYDKKRMCLDKIYEPTGDVDADMLAIKQYYHACGARGKRHEKFSTGL